MATPMLHALSAIVDQTPLGNDIRFYPGVSAWLNANPVATTVIGSGNLPAGYYRFAYTWTSPLGESRLGGICTEEHLLLADSSIECEVPGTDTAFSIIIDTTYTLLKHTSRTLYAQCKTDPGGSWGDTWYQVVVTNNPIITSSEAVTLTYTGAVHTATMAGTPVLISAIGTQLSLGTSNWITAATGTETINEANPDFVAVDINNNSGVTLTEVQAYIIQNMREIVPQVYTNCEIYYPGKDIWASFDDLLTDKVIGLGTDITDGNDVTYPLCFRFVLPLGQSLGTVITPIGLTIKTTV